MALTEPSSQADFAKQVRVYVRAWRKALGLSQAKFAERVDVHERTINELERGGRGTTPATLRLIVDGAAPAPEEASHAFLCLVASRIDDDDLRAIIAALAAQALHSTPALAGKSAPLENGLRDRTFQTAWSRVGRIFTERNESDEKMARWEAVTTLLDSYKLDGVPRINAGRTKKQRQPRKPGVRNFVTSRTVARG